MKVTNYSVDSVLSIHHNIFNFIVRSKIDLLELMASVLEILLDKNRVTEEACQLDKVLGEQDLKISIAIGKMRRIFLFSSCKYVSFFFPFSLDLRRERGEIKFLPEGYYIGHHFISTLRSTVKAIRNNNNQILETCIDIILDSKEVDYSFWEVFNHLIQMEDGYLRYDHDTENEDGDYHPEHHLDFFYSQSITFKLGLREKLPPKSLRNILNIKKICSYLDINE